MKKLSKLVAATVIASSVIGLTSTLAWLIPIAKFSSSDARLTRLLKGHALMGKGQSTILSEFLNLDIYIISWLHFLET